jgi:preprotein translocase subunit SecF
LTGLTTWVVAVILYAVGGPAIHGFAFCLVLGVMVGTYSSIYVASPLLLWRSRPEGRELHVSLPSEIVATQPAAR